jgi:prolyl oligopeptidase
MNIPATTYPPTPRHDFAFTAGSASIVDPYAWLEEDSPASLEWQAQQNELAERTLRSWPRYPQLSALAALAAAPARYPRTNWLPAGPHTFALGRPNGSDAVCLLMARNGSSSAEVLYDPSTRPLHQPGTIDWYFPSPDGQHIALGLCAGDEWHTYLHVLSVESGEFEPHSALVNGHVEVAWTPDSRGFLYAFADFDSAADPSTLWGRPHIFHFRLGGDGPQEQVLELEGMWTPPHVSEDGRYVYVYAGVGEQRPYYIAPVADTLNWSRFLADQSGSIVGTLLGERFIAIETSTQYPRARLVDIPIATGDDRDTWTELVPMGQRIMRSIAQVDGRIVVHGFEDLQTKVWVFEPDGRLVHEVTPSELGTLAPVGTRPTGGWDDVQPILADADGSGFSFYYTSYTISPRRLHVDLRTGQLEDRSDQPPIQLNDLVVSRRSLRSKDGTELQLLLVTRQDHDVSKPSPTFLTAYGAFRNTTLPSYLGALAAFVRSGGVFAEVLIRGGGEFGHDWWQAGRYERKQDSFDDVYAAAEYLFASGIAERGRLAFYGCSHGGMLAGTVLTQRPDLFGAVVVGAPVLDLLRFHLDPYLAWACIKEYGNPLDREESGWLRAYSPYHNVRQGVKYPPVLIICGEQDQRTRPLHGRKMVAQLQAAGASTALLRVYRGRHQQVCDRASNPGQIAEWLGFVMHHLGMQPAAAGPSTGS